MEYFLFILILSYIFAFSKNEKKNINAAFVVIIAMILLNGLRSLDVGRDTLNYYMMYSYTSISERIEPLFRYLIVTSRTLDLSFNAFLIIVALLIYLPLYGFIKRWSINPSMSLIVYMVFSVFFMQNSYNVLRNCIAASFLLWGIGYIKDNRYRPAILFCLLAVGFHYSAFFTFPLLILSHFSKNLKPRIVIPLLLGSIVVGLYTSFYDDLFTLALQHISIFSGGVAENYSNYLSEISEIEVNTNGVIMLIVPFSIVSLLSFMSEKIDKYLRMVLFYGVFLGNLFVNVLYTYRLTTFLTLTTIVIIPNLIKQDNKYIRISAISIVIAMTSYYIYSLWTGSANNIIPYNFCFN